MRAHSLFAPFLLFACFLTASAQDPKTDPKTDDPIAAELLKAKEAYVASVEKAKEGMLKVFDKTYDTVKNNKFLKIDVQLAQLEKIEEEKKAFEEKDVLPTLPGLKTASSDYRTAQRKAEVACKAAFEKAAKAYRDKSEVKLASATLDEMKEFLASVGGVAAVPMMIRCGNSSLVLGLQGGKTEDGTKVVTAEYEKGDQTQLWKIIPATDGYAYIENVKTGFVMTAKGKNEGTELVIAKKDPDSEYQLWKLPPVATVRGAVKIVPKPSGRPLGIWAKSTDPGTGLVVWTDSNENHRYFGFFPPK